MKRLIVAGCRSLLVAGLVVGVMLWRSSGVRVFNDHIMGESGNDFAKIEANRTRLILPNATLLADQKSDIFHILSVVCVPLPDEQVAAKEQSEC